jgi:polysaccharide export outer membrane protein
MRWTYRIGLALLAAVIAGVPARAADAPNYSTMQTQRSWTPDTAQQQPQLRTGQPAAAPAPVRVASVAPMPSLSNGPDDYMLGTGDKVHVTVYGEDDLSGEFQVDSTGFVRLPMIGQVRASGLTARALEAAITSGYAQGYLLQPRVNVEVTLYRPFYIIGEVNRPGQYPYVNGMNVLNAVALAGGYTQKAIEGHVYLRKNGTAKEEKVNADAVTEVDPGDIVRVDSNPLWDIISIVGPLAPFAATRY